MFVDSNKITTAMNAVLHKYLLLDVSCIPFIG